MNHRIKKIAALLSLAILLLCGVPASGCASNEGLDFVVKVEKGKTPVVLHLTDPQIVEEDDALKERKCYRYIRETIEATDPDLILITGDLVYGKYDTTGEALLELIDFMESFQIPWAPVFGNHDNESKMGVAWQCEQLENARHCYFRRGDCRRGNGNYTIGIRQGGKLTRVFFMLDSGGCSAVSAQSLEDGGVLVTNGVEFPQMEWMEERAKTVLKHTPEANFSAAFHIQHYTFADALQQYGYGDSYLQPLPINIDLHPQKKAGDFGYLGRDLKGGWDSFGDFQAILEEYGFDSVFVGHEHCNSASVVYNGIRYQYGQKSSEYDRKNFLQQDGSILGAYTADLPPLLGGTVVPLSAGKGEIENPYIYLCDTWTNFQWSENE